MCVFAFVRNDPRYSLVIVVVIVGCELAELDGESQVTTRVVE